MSLIAYLRYRDRYSGTITVSSEDAIYPRENLDVLPVAQPWRSQLGDVASQWIDIDLGSAVPVDFLMLVAHNFSEGAVINLNAGPTSSPDGSTFTTVVSPRERTAWRKFTAQTYRYWRIEINDPANDQGYLAAGLLLIGQSTSLTEGFTNASFLWSDESHVRESESELGVPHVGSTLYDLSRLSIAFESVNRQQAAELRAWLVGLHGRREPLGIVPNPDAYDEALFGRLSSPVTRAGIQGSEFKFNMGPFEFVEDHPGEAIREPLYLPDVGDLNEWDAGDGVSSFTRASAARYKDSGLVLQAKASGELRQLHYFSAAEAGLLIEPAGQNDYTRSEELDDAAWTKSEATISANATAAPDGQTTADKLVESVNTAVHQLARSITAASIANDTKQAISLFVKSAERTKFRVLIVQKDAGSSFFDVDLGSDTIGTVTGDAVPILEIDWASSWRRLLIAIDSANGATDMQVAIRLLDAGGNESYAGDGASGLYLWGMQFEIDRPWPTSYMQSPGAVNGTRAAEIVYLTATFPPQPVSIYCRWIDLGSVQVDADGEVAPVLMGDAGGSHFAIRQASTLRAFHDNGTSTVNSAIANAGGHGDVVEALATVDGTGAVTIHRRVNGGAATDGSASGALALPAAWGAPGPLRLGVAVSGLVAPVLLQRVALGRGILDWGDLDS